MPFSSDRPMLHVLCARPGLIRGGVSHPSHAAHPHDAFSETQMREMLAEPAIAVVYGQRILPEDLSDMFGATEADRTRMVGSRIDTDAGANARTETLAQVETAKRDMQRAEGALDDAGLAEDVATAEEAALAPTNKPRRTAR